MTPPALTVYGRDDARDVWVERDADMICLTPGDLATMRLDVTANGTTMRAGHQWDESDVDLLLGVLAQGPTLWACRRCTHRPVLRRNDDLCERCGASDDVAEASIAQTRAVG